MPEDALLSVKTARADARFRRVCGPGTEAARLLEHSLLTMHLLQQLDLGDDSAWSPFLRTLPSTFTLLGTFSDEAAASLQVRVHGTHCQLLPGGSGDGQAKDKRGRRGCVSKA